MCRDRVLSGALHLALCLCGGVNSFWYSLGVLCVVGTLRSLFYLYFRTIQENPNCSPLPRQSRIDLTTRHRSSSTASQSL